LTSLMFSLFASSLEGDGGEIAVVPAGRDGARVGPTSVGFDA
jgi:hypothetical protein